MLFICTIVCNYGYYSIMLLILIIFTVLQIYTVCIENYYKLDKLDRYDNCIFEIIVTTFIIINNYIVNNIDNNKIFIII